MKTSTRSPASKRAVNLALYEDVVQSARQLTDSLSGSVERELQWRRERSRQIEATVALWNAFEERHGAFTDEYSTL